MMVIVTLLVAMLLHLHVPIVNGDYMCVCYYDTTKEVYAEPDTSSTELGVMYEFDCMALVNMSNADGFYPIMFEKQVSQIIIELYLITFLIRHLKRNG